jgi:hypothetical protein
VAVSEPKRVEIPYRPRSYQLELHALMDRYRFFVLVAHRRLGKTVLSVNQLIKRGVKDKKEMGRYGYIAPFRNQGKQIAWDYLKYYTRGLPGIRVYENDLRIRFHGGLEIRIYGADNPDSLRGQYFDGVIIDEVAQIKRELWEEVVRPAVSDRQGWAVFIGTPKGVNYFFDLYNHAKRGEGGWGCAVYDIERTMRSPDPPLSGPELADIRAESPKAVYDQEFMCDFNSSGADTLIPLALAVEAAGRSIKESSIEGLPVILGVDVARFGDDDSAICRRQGPAVLELWSGAGLRTDDLVTKIMHYDRKYSPELICVDPGGGQGVIDYGRRVLEGKVIEVPFGSRAVDEMAYVNRRTEMWAAMRRFLQDGGCIPEDSALISQLAAPTYSYDNAGRMALEKKSRVKDRLSVSPDKADAMALTFAVQVMPEALRRALPRRAVGRRPFWGRGADWM